LQAPSDFRAFRPKIRKFQAVLGPSGQKFASSKPLSRLLAKKFASSKRFSRLLAKKSQSPSGGGGSQPHSPQVSSGGAPPGPTHRKTFAPELSADSDRCLAHDLASKFAALGPVQRRKIEN
jgi:hypothetical protein